MSKIFCKALGIASALLSATLVLASSTLASEVPTTESNSGNRVKDAPQPTPALKQNNQYSQLTNTVQVTSVSELSDVNPTDWAFQALQSLVERYHCIVGYPDGIYQGNRTLSRYEFAVGVEACLNQVNKLIAEGTAEVVKKGDLVVLQRLQSEFAPELSTLGQHLDNLEARTSQLTAQQFSTTTKFRGEAIFALIGASGQKANDNDSVDDNIVFGSRLRLAFNTSFTGKDRLLLRLQARNIPRFDEDVTGTSMTRLGFEGNSRNRLEIDTLQYLFPIGKRGVVYINAQASSDDFADTVNPLFDSGGRGSISRFGRRNPIYRQIGSTGVGINYELSKAVTLGLGYLADDANDPRSGIFKGPYGAIAQLIIQPNKALDLGLTYVRSYNTLNTGTGSELANDPFDRDADHITANSFGVEGTFQVSRTFILGGWVGYTKAKAEDLPNKPEAEIFNYAITLAFRDLGAKGNLAGIVFGQPPKVISNGLGKNFTDPDISFHLEIFYRFQANDKISITPGLLIITNPEHNDSNDTIYLGVVRTTFAF
ncbi:iron uptake porin [Mastigocladopsis repens]|uniref:iron uptake porin n=1 Tax=Mastigocladopsis repens TaxID=221287 RepID=UPI0002E0AB93|nr:iron uptake porin [Mastigocladopsis repens]